MKHPFNAFNHLFCAVIPTPKKNESVPLASLQRKQSRIIKISGYDYPLLFNCIINNFTIRGAGQSHIHNMDCIMPFRSKPHG